MSTRAMYTFIDKYGKHHVYKHHDGYPSGGCTAIKNALNHSWQLPRFEADDFAAAFVAGNKPSLNWYKEQYPDSKHVEDMVGGGIRLMNSGKWQDVAPRDIVFRYEIFMVDQVLTVKCYEAGFDKQKEQLLFEGSLDVFDKWIEERTKQDV